MSFDSGTLLLGVYPEENYGGMLKLNSTNGHYNIVYNSKNEKQPKIGRLKRKANHIYIR